MKNIILLTLLSTFAFSGFFNESEIKVDQAQKDESARLCKIYTKKASDYKSEMRDDQFTKATLKNYVRLESKYCNPNS